MSNPIQAKFILTLLEWFNTQLQNTVKIHSYGGFLNMKYNKKFALLITLTHVKRRLKKESVNWLELMVFQVLRYCSGMPSLLLKSRCREAHSLSLSWMLQWGRMNSNVCWGSYFPHSLLSMKDMTPSVTSKITICVCFHRLWSEEWHVKLLP